MSLIHNSRPQSKYVNKTLYFEPEFALNFQVDCAFLDKHVQPVGECSTVCLRTFRGDSVVTLPDGRSTLPSHQTTGLKAALFSGCSPRTNAVCRSTHHSHEPAVLFTWCQRATWNGGGTMNGKVSKQKIVKANFFLIIHVVKFRLRDNIHMFHVAVWSTVLHWLSHIPQLGKTHRCLTPLSFSTLSCDLLSLNVLT